MSKPISQQTIVITGGSLGIGAAAARALRKQGANVAITGRSAETMRLADEIGAKGFFCDYKDLSSVRELAAQLLEAYPTIDVLANNVGAIMNQRHLTQDGYEATFQVNHLGGFLLTALLQERLNASQALIVNTSSIGNTMGLVKLDDLQNAQGYNAMRAYGTAKLMNILHAKELQRRYGKYIRAASFHPGPVATGFGREGSWLVKLAYETPLKNLFLISPEKGADTLLWLLSSEAGKDWQPGGYYSKRKPGRKHRQADDAELARQLWEASESLLGLQSGQPA